MTTTTRDRRVQVLLDRHGTTFAEEAGITLRDEPSPLYRLLVLCVLLSAPIASATATAAARALASAGLRTPRATLNSSWQQRVDALGSAGYRRFDERTATMLGDGAQLLGQRWGGDMRRLHDEAEGDVGRLRRLLQEVPRNRPGRVRHLLPGGPGRLGRRVPVPRRPRAGRRTQAVASLVAFHAGSARRAA